MGFSPSEPDDDIKFEFGFWKAGQPSPFQANGPLQTGNGYNFVLSVGKVLVYACAVDSDEDRVCSTLELELKEGAVTTKALEDMANTIDLGALVNSGDVKNIANVGGDGGAVIL